VPVIPSQPGLELIKTADRASAQPGDVVVYRLLVKNTGITALTNFRVTDTMPVGMKLRGETVRGAVSGQPVTLGPTTTTGRNTVFTFPGVLEPRQTLEITYAVVLTPDAIRGNGRNVATALGQQSVSGLATGPDLSAPASYQLRIQNGILSDCGTVLGRVFEDRNFDGEQQPGEPGIPNAVIFMDDGNRVTTDANGLFSLAYVISGYRTGTLDLTSLPGYTLAPNLYRIEGNSRGRLVKLAPGGLVRMNFAVTPSFKEGQR
jgi:uncharacterized repeat protein (TIGR01451 family)